MGGRPESRSTLYYHLDLERLVPATHPLRAIRTQADTELKSLSPRFTSAHSDTDRPSIPPEQLSKASLL
jgi:hypothetical protein